MKQLNNICETDLATVREELLTREDQYITFKDLVDRFDEIDKEYNHSSWNLLQIYSNFNILIGKEEDVWQQLKETIIEIKDNNKYDNTDVNEVCQFLLNYMDILEKEK